MKIPASTKREKQMKIKISSTCVQQINQWKSEILSIAMVWSYQDFHQMFIKQNDSIVETWKMRVASHTKLNGRNMTKIVSMWLLY